MEGIRMRKYKSTSSRIFDFFVVLILVMMTLACLLPLMHIVAISLSSKFAAMTGNIGIFPVEFTTTAYEVIMKDAKYISGLMVSAKRVILGTSINLVLSCITAFSLSQSEKDFPARKYYMWIFLFAMLFGAGMIPRYLMVKATGLLNSIWALILPGALPIYNTIILMNFFRGLPKEIKESAVWDGISPIKMLWYIYIPLSMPSIATITLFSAVGHWNEFFNGLIYMNDPQNIPLQSYIYTLNTNNLDTSMMESLTMEQVEALTSARTFNSAKVVCAALPIVLFYPFMQKFFVKGLTLGSVKE